MPRPLRGFIDKAKTRPTTTPPPSDSSSGTTPPHRLDLVELLRQDVDDIIQRRLGRSDQAKHE